MLHLVSVDTSEEADEISQRFHASGVPVFVEPDLTRTDPSVRSAALGIAFISGSKSNSTMPSGYYVIRSMKL